MTASRQPAAPRPGAASTPAAPGTKSAGPGRPKDMGKRAAILEAAKRMFTQHGFDGASMDQIAAEAGVSKLTVYSHFGDKDTLFTEAVERYCEQQMPASVFESAPETPVRARVRCGALSGQARDIWLSLRRADVLVFERQAETA